MNVLLVEDDREMRLLVARLLRRRGHTLAACADAEDAWRICQVELPPLLLVDWLLPGMDGLELCRRIRGLPGGRSAVILVMTVRTSPGDLERVLAAGADDYLPKPFDARAIQVRLGVAERHVEVVQARDRAEAALLEKSRLEGALLAAGSVQHYLGNQLALTLGYSELLARDPRLHPELRPLAEEASAGVIEARQTLEKLNAITRLATDEARGGPPVLDLERSSRREP